jgi:hypothetical protein
VIGSGDNPEGDDQKSTKSHEEEEEDDGDNNQEEETGGKHDGDSSNSKLGANGMKSFMEQLLFRGQDYSDDFGNLTYQWAPREITESAQTKFFICLNLICPLLYWYNAFHGMLSNKFIILCPMGLMCGEVLVALWRTRCSNPVIHAVLFNPFTMTCRLVKEQAQWSRLVACLNPLLEFDLAALVEYV